MDYRGLYGPEKAREAEARFRSVQEGYAALRVGAPEKFFSSPGRTEIIGNHTDHNGGKVIVAAIDCDILAAVGRREDGVVEICSKGFRPVRFRLSDTSPRRAEAGRSASLARGVAEGIRRKGYRVGKMGGFSAYTESTVFRGAGVSSSAAFEILVAEIFNVLFLDGALSPADKAEIGHFAEDVYFGKPCGLLDQSGVAFGGLNKMDFADPAKPLVSPLPPLNGYSLVLVNAGGSHSALTRYYADIRREMEETAAFFGKRILREVREEEFLDALPALKGKVSERAILRAAHFFAENRRTDGAADALLRGDVTAFLRLLRESGESSQKYLQNCFVPRFPSPDGSAGFCQSLIFDRTRKIGLDRESLPEFPPPSLSCGFSAGIPRFESRLPPYPARRRILFIGCGFGYFPNSIRQRPCNFQNR